MDEIREGELNPESLVPIIMKNEEGQNQVYNETESGNGVNETTNVECDAITAPHSYMY